MATNEEHPQRKSPRADWLEYNEGRYFVTVCTRDHRHCFGEIENGVMTLTTVGRYLDEELKNAALHQSYIRVLQHVVMPNHFHAIIEVDSGDANIVGTRHGVSVENIKNADASCKCRDAINCVRETNNEQTDAMYCVPTSKGYKRPLLSLYIGFLKAAVTRYARANGIPFAWQPRYHDHAIRGVDDNNNISQYIANNVLNWEKDCFY
ncbi:MAG: transposase [Mediterranea massiliensis]|nr:transposase [Mediterranea massiliensis]